MQRLSLQIESGAFVGNLIVSPASLTHRRIETRLPATRYFWPISPRGEEPDSTFLIVVSAMIGWLAHFVTVAAPASVKSDSSSASLALARAMDSAVVST